MSRDLRATRAGLTLSDDTQRLIDYQPTWVSTYRKGAGDGIHTAKGSLSFVGSFQGLMTEYERVTRSMIDLSEPYGTVAKSIYLLITRVGQDIYGNPINIREGDVVLANNYSYLVDSSVNFSFRNECILEYLQ